ncbi:16S rRNA (uracil(1498)-N(3))-methyltransferase [Nodosilinea sp. LEGE 06152]|uniref:16S rRNA (uracil(1498)-N(3))-methyltransferase n=1 Tax=Nodosilinea sp. LEGE 06152 TaxID=2777966 RepID=UPI00187FF570|nr:16S rRNA (uracil(1498)-N(3))-methyltransferase [Nodosilinea sp. LEGE 06152]MBE9156307.1 16S rRNA (uracil(1498)-N(3))-methyltransferase [Nodosilinea sp. LEGE 06152]
MVEPNQVVANQLRLSSSQQHYLYRVLRLGAGQQFVALDGLGQQWLATLTAVPDQAAIAPLPVSATATQAPITLAIALPKGSGFDDVVRQTTELGVSTIQPVISDRTLHQPNPKKLERWQRIALEATEQSERLLLPKILPPLPWRDYLQQTTEGQRWICVARGDAPHLLAAAQVGDPLVPAAIAIGPEGGWTAAEVEAAIAAEFQPVSLGPYILRAVTAPLAALTLVSAARALNYSLANSKDI